MEDIIIRGAMPEDAEALLAVYAPYVPETAITFEYEVPTAAEFASRIERTLQRYPYLVAVSDGEILGYAYLSPLGERKAYEHAAETSVYLRRDVRGRGLGKRLYQRLEEIAAAQRITRLYACIAYTAEEDEHLTNASTRFHESVGYTEVGHFHGCGYKFGRCYDVLWMEKVLAEGAPDGAFIPYPEL